MLPGNPKLRSVLAGYIGPSHLTRSHDRRSRSVFAEGYIHNTCEFRYSNHLIACSSLLGNMMSLDAGPIIISLLIAYMFAISAPGWTNKQVTTRRYGPNLVRPSSRTVNSPALNHSWTPNVVSRERVWTGSKHWASNRAVRSDPVAMRHNAPRPNKLSTWILQAGSESRTVRSAISRRIEQDFGTLVP